MQVILTETENRIISLIKRFSAELDSMVTPRIAGGWVRDKLLGLESQDIDIALD